MKIWELCPGRSQQFYSLGPYWWSSGLVTLPISLPSNTWMKRPEQPRKEVSWALLPLAIHLCHTLLLSSTSPIPFSSNRQRSTPTPDPRLFNGFGLYRRVSSLSAPLYCIPILQRFFKLSRKHAKFLNWTPSMYGGNRMYTSVSFRSLVFLELHPPNTTPWFLP